MNLQSYESSFEQSRKDKELSNEPCKVLRAIPQNNFEQKVDITLTNDEIKSSFSPNRKMTNSLKCGSLDKENNITFSSVSGICK